MSDYRRFESFFDGEVIMYQHNEKRPKELAIMTCLIIQLFTLMVPLVRLLITRPTIASFSMEGQFLFTVGYLLKYLHNPELNSDVPAGELFGYVVVFQIRTVLGLAMGVTLLLALCTPGYFEEQPGRYWLIGGIITSFVLAAEFTNYNRSHMTTIICTFGTYLEALSWIPQLKLAASKNRLELPLCIYIFGMFFYEMCNVADTTYDYYHVVVAKEMRIKFFLIKTMLFCGFLIKQANCARNIADASADFDFFLEGDHPSGGHPDDVVVVSSAKEYSNKVLFQSLGVEQDLINTKLMSPY